MFQVRFHGRGGQGVVTAAELLASAAFGEDRHAQDMERARLARELHDVVAHQLSAIAVQAGAARLAAAGDPQAAATAIAAIERQARGGLTLIASVFGLTVGRKDEITHEAIPAEGPRSPAA